MHKTILFLSFIASCLYLSSQEIRLEDKIRIAEAHKIAKNYSDRIWKDFAKTPFTIILVTEEYEYLINHSNPSADFKLLNYDSILNTNVFYRKTKFNKHFLATFPAVNGANCIVVGTPENTNKTSTDWIITLLHEHFHQYTYNSKDYFKDVNNLNLSKGDTSGMWMINYPFPYSNKKVIKLYNSYAKSIKHLIEEDLNQKRINKYLKTKRKLKKNLSTDDYKYLSFQIWQEGIARYTEIKFLKLLLDYKTSERVENLKDFISFEELLNKKLTQETYNITSLKLDEAKRVCFYAIGMAEGLILDKLDPNWRDKYLSEKFTIDNYYFNEKTH